MHRSTHVLIHGLYHFTAKVSLFLRSTTSCPRSEAVGQHPLPRYSDQRRDSLKGWLLIGAREL